MFGTKKKKTAGGLSPEMRKALDRYYETSEEYANTSMGVKYAADSYVSASKEARAARKRLKEFEKQQRKMKKRR